MVDLLSIVSRHFVDLGEDPLLASEAVYLFCVVAQTSDWFDPACGSVCLSVEAGWLLVCCAVDC